MPKLIALRTLYGDYGSVAPGQTFETDIVSAESLRARGLVEIYRDPSLIERLFKATAPPENKAIQPPENKTVIAIQQMPSPPIVKRENRHWKGRR